ncbi:MAG: DUF4340 domain-containing protein [Marinicellaceae bacterium]
MKNSIKILVSFLVSLLIISYFVLKSKDDFNTNSGDSYLIPELKNQINDVDHITISKNEKTVTLTKIKGVWRIIEVNNYLADANLIATLLLNLREFKLKSTKTAKVENYSQLSLDQSGENAGTQIRLKNNSELFADIIIGKKAQRSQGYFVRKINNAQTWLSEGTINLILNPSDWIVSTIIDRDISQIKSVSFRSNEQEFLIDKITPQDPSFVLVDLPDDMQIKSSVDLNELANGLQKLSIETANPRKEFMVNPILSITYQLFSGMKYHLNITQMDQEYLLNIDIENPDSASSSDKQLINWTYTIANYKFDALNKKLTDIIEMKKIDQSESVN